MRIMPYVAYPSKCGPRSRPEAASTCLAGSKTDSAVDYREALQFFGRAAERASSCEFVQGYPKLLGVDFVGRKRLPGSNALLIGWAPLASWTSSTRRQGALRGDQPPDPAVLWEGGFG